ncbi:hypothetical protein CHH83_02300 [Bacillus sp. 7586-K]|nr:hypothetical protein CHH83_02300 [Bacillus sp. 7586-K]
MCQDLKGSDVVQAINLTNNLIMFDSQLERIKNKYSLDITNMSYKELITIFKRLDDKLYFLIESK